MTIEQMQSQIERDNKALLQAVEIIDRKQNGLRKILTATTIEEAQAIAAEYLEPSGQ